MTELIQALTRLANAAAVYLEEKDGGGREPELPLETASAEPAPAKRGRRTKAEIEAANAQEPKAKPEVKAPEMSDEQSADAVLTVCKQYVERFKNATPSGLDRARTLRDSFKVAKITDLVHAQRLLFIAKLQAEIAEADGKVTA